MTPITLHITSTASPERIREAISMMLCYDDVPDQAGETRLPLRLLLGDRNAKVEIEPC